MRNSTHRLQAIRGNSLDKSNIFIEVNSLAWRSPNKMSLQELIDQIKIHELDISRKIDNKTIVLDPHTLKIKIEDSLVNTSNVYHEYLNKPNISINTPPKNASTVTGLHLMSDSNYMYIWTGNQWKRVALSEW
jgi:hypothetical protein